MSRIVYVNGEYLPEGEAKISVFDRGFLFADGIYEVSSVLDGRPIDNAAHIARMHRSLNELKMDAPCSDAELLEIQRRSTGRSHGARRTVTSVFPMAPSPLWSCSPRKSRSPARRRRKRGSQ